jgi:hypothetical protein
MTKDSEPNGSKHSPKILVHSIYGCKNKIANRGLLILTSKEKDITAPHIQYLYSKSLNVVRLITRFTHTADKGTISTTHLALRSRYLLSRST